MNGYIKSPIPIKSSCWVPQYRWQAPPSPNDRQNAILIVTWEFVLRTSLQFTQSPKQPCFPQFCRKTRHPPQSSDLPDSLTQDQRTTKTCFQLCLGVSHASGDGPLVLSKEGSLEELSDWSTKFLPVLKSIILLRVSFKTYQGARRSWQVKPISSWESP